MKLNTGAVVKATAGRDGGKFFVVVSSGNDFCMIADGKSRKLSAPKRKNIKHLALTKSMSDINDLTDKKLRNLLRTFGGNES